MNKKYVVRLSDSERDACQKIIKDLKGSSQKFRPAQILLKVDADGPAWSDDRVAEAFNCRTQTIENVRKRLVTEGFELALEGKKRREPPTPCKLDGEAETKLIAMRLGRPPAGHGHWTLQLLADEMVALEIVDTISHETIRQVLKKTTTRHPARSWAIRDSDVPVRPGESAVSFWIALFS
jgi:Homeodomain-like domain